MVCVVVFPERPLVWNQNNGNGKVYYFTLILYSVNCAWRYSIVPFLWRRKSQRLSSALNNKYVLTSLSFPVHCLHPGNIENGQVLLVGNLGYFVYRPYITTVQNDKQILFECRKGYKIHSGPTGATCIRGRWSPSNMPKCIPDKVTNHPTLLFLSHLYWWSVW